MGHPIRLKDGTVVLAELKPGVVLTKDEEEALAEFCQYVRDESDRVKTLPRHRRTRKKNEKTK